MDANFSDPGKHAPDIEKGNQTLEERFHVQFYRLPFEALPNVMVWCLPLRITRDQYLFQKAEGISKYFSPHILLKRWQIGYNKEFQFSYENYFQAHNDLDPKNNNFPRSIDAIYLSPLDKQQEGHQIMDLQTGCMSFQGWCKKWLSL